MYISSASQNEKRRKNDFVNFLTVSKTAVHIYCNIASAYWVFDLLKYAIEVLPNHNILLVSAFEQLGFYFTSIYFVLL